MKKLHSWLVIVLVCFGSALLGQSGLSSNHSLNKALLYYTIDPMIVQKGDASSLHTIEVTTSGVDIARVYLTNHVEANLVDDGANGDRIAGDGVYTAGNVYINTDRMPLSFGTFGAGGPDVFVEKMDGSSESTYLRFGVVAKDLNFPAVKLADGIFATQYALFLEDPDGLILDTEDWPLGDVKCGRENFYAAQKLYSVLPDDFDFIIVMPAHAIFDPARNYSENTPYFVRAKNDIKNIGIEIFDNTATFGSAGRLTGMVYHSWSYGAILDHEIAHSWSADMGKSLGLTMCADCNGNHWNPLSDIGGQMSAFLFPADVNYNAGHLKNNGDGTWRIERAPGDDDCYSKLDLYAMGLIPSSEVPPVHLLVNPDLTDPMRVTTESVMTFTIDDIIAAEGGERIPSFQDSPKEFNAAFVVVKNKAFTAEEYAYYSSLSKYFASQEQGKLSLTTFYHATGGRATLNPNLGVITSVESKIAAASGFYLHQNFPNPFNPETTIRFDLEEPNYVRLEIYNILGEKAATVAEAEFSAGPHKVAFSGSELPSGIYFYKVEIGNFAEIKKMVLME